MPPDGGLAFRLEGPAPGRIGDGFANMLIIHVKPEPGAGRRATGEAHGATLIIFNGINAKPCCCAGWRGWFRHLQQARGSGF